MDMRFQHVPYVQYMGLVLHPHIQTPKSQPKINIATGYDQRQETAHTIQNAFTGSDGKEEGDDKEEHHPSSPGCCSGTKTRKDSRYHMHAVAYLVRTVGCVASYIKPQQFSLSRKRVL
jgi:hypothetical protein